MRELVVVVLVAITAAVIAAVCGMEIALTPTTGPNMEQMQQRPADWKVRKPSVPRYDFARG